METPHPTEEEEEEEVQAAGHFSSLTLLLLVERRMSSVFRQEGGKKKKDKKRNPDIFPLMKWHHRRSVGQSGELIVGPGPGHVTDGSRLIKCSDVAGGPTRAISSRL